MLSPQIISAIFKSIDDKDATTFSSFFTDNGRFIYGAQMDVAGKESVEQAVAGFFTSLDSLSHSNIRSWDGGDGVMFVAGDVHYVLPNGKTADIPFLNKFELNGEKIAHYHVFTDPTPMFQAATAE